MDLIYIFHHTDLASYDLIKDSTQLTIRTSFEPTQMTELSGKGGNISK